ncbi:hypothetical protein EW145_g6507 [Phellinidium pouzarii]|uniref:Fungal-type protein kinase domain-containing protein n=1 Tax=Phellinidium pouzarii TaxID=167371 RepID=A0A4S4KY81_9AGAM|nr:hypothetical protein EW145_g6507 [Phellinidium pouzarii]
MDTTPLDVAGSPEHQFPVEVMLDNVMPSATPIDPVHAPSDTNSSSDDTDMTEEGDASLHTGSPSVDTPTKAKFLQDRCEHNGWSVARDGCLGSSSLDVVEDFERYYLHHGEAYSTKEWEIFKTERKNELDKSKTECDMCKPITGDRNCLSSLPGSTLRPDIVAIWVNRDDAIKIASGTADSREIFWYEIVSLIEVKRTVKDMPSSVQTGTYLHILPRGLPYLAGLLFVHWDRARIHLYWSDTSGIVRSHSYYFDEEIFWTVLFNYVRSVADPLPHLPTRDPTMTINIRDPLHPTWNIQTLQNCFDASLMFASNAHGRQTCIFMAEAARRVIKDLWQDDDRRFQEELSLDRTSVRQVLVAIYDSVQEFEDMPEAKFIRQVLDPTLTTIQEEDILIDWDNAADLDEAAKKSVSLSGRTGTPMFIAIAVGTGKLKIKERERENFPELTGRAKELYEKAYGPEKYKKYRDAVNGTDIAKNRNGHKVLPKFQHAAHHDVESFFWVIVYELLSAWPEGEEVCLNESSNNFLQKMQGHTFGAGEDDDVRTFAADLGLWRKRLHPRLKIVAGMVQEIQDYVATEWAFWADDNLPEDHCHEAIKIILLKTIVMLDELGDPIPLKQVERKPVKHPDARSQNDGPTIEERPSKKARSSARSSDSPVVYEESDRPEENFFGIAQSSANEGTDAPHPSLPAALRTLRSGTTTTTRRLSDMPPPPPPSDARPRSQSTENRRFSYKGKEKMEPSPSEKLQ